MNYDYNGTLVSVGARFDINGNVVPLDVIIDGVQYRVYDFISRKIKPGNKIEYKCHIVNGKAEKDVVLLFFLADMVWVLKGE